MGATGPTGDAGPIGPAGPAGDAGSFPACASGFTAVNSGRLCVGNALEATATMYSAIPVCGALPGTGNYAHVCTYSEAMVACDAGILFYSSTGAGWYGDILGDDQFETWNVNSCVVNNNGLSMNGASVSLPYRCCY
jgi:hypothetical protein